MGVLLQLKTPHRAVLAIVLVGAVVASLAWLCVRDPKITFLVGRRAGGMDTVPVGSGYCVTSHCRTGRGIPA